MATFEEVVTRYWWTLVARGVVAILFGILAIVWPSVTIAALVLLIGAYAVVDGVASIVLGVQEYGEHERWWAVALVGLVSLVAGIVTFLAPGITLLTLMVLIAVWLLVRGVLEIVAAIQLRRVIEGEWMLALGGLLSIAFGLLFLIVPGFGVLALATWLGIYAVVLGVGFVLLGLRARRARRPLAA